MSTIVSGALYFMSPLMAANTPAAEAVEMFDARSIAAASGTGGTEGASQPSHIRGYVIFDAPAINHDHKSFLDAAIKEEVGKRIDAPSRLASMGLLDEADGASSPSDDLSSAVIAAHDQRIALLKQRLQAIRSGTVADAHSQELQVRLRRAVAARRLAANRATELVSASTLCSTVLAHDCQGASREIASDVVARFPVSATRRTASRTLLQDGQGAALRRNVQQSIGLNQSIEHRLAKARRALDVARNLLEEPSPREQPAVQITGLWRWPGSDIWTLDNRSSRLT